MKRLFICFLIVSIWIVGPTPPARAGTVFGDLASIVTDPLKFGKLSENFKDGVLQALAQINALADKADGIAKARLEQLKSIIDGAIKGAIDAEKVAFDELNKLEAKLVSDIQTILSDIQCAAIVAAEGTLQNALVTALRSIAETQPTLSIIGLPVAKLSTSAPPDLPSPDAVFYQARDEVNEKLKSLKDGDKAYRIVSAYGNLARLAMRTRCFYKRQEFEKQFIREEGYYSARIASWYAILNVVN